MGLSEKEILDIFCNSGALQEGHFLLTSGLHSDRYIEKFKVLQSPQYTDLLCGEIARRFEKAGIEVVVGPATGGILLAYAVGRILQTRAIFTERESNRMMLRRGFGLRAGERVLVVEDVITTGGSVNEVIEVVLDQEAKLSGVGLLVDRSGGKVNFSAPTEALLKLDLETFLPENCPLCRKQIPLRKPGSKKIPVEQG